MEISNHYIGFLGAPPENVIHLAVSFSLVFCFSMGSALATHLIPILSPLFWLLNGLMASWVLKAYYMMTRNGRRFVSLPEVTSSKVRAPSTTSSSLKRQRPGKEKNTPKKQNRFPHVDTSLPQDYSALEQVSCTLKAPFSEVADIINQNIKKLAGKDLQSMDTVVEKKEGGKLKRTYHEHIYRFDMREMPSALKRAIGGGCLEVKEFVMDDRTNSTRTSRFVNTSFQSMFRIAIVETYLKHPDNAASTLFTVKAAMKVNLPWPVGSFATNFAKSQYQPKIQLKVERIRGLISDNKS